VIVADPVERARALIAFADGVEQAGWIDYARRARDVARDVLELAERLDATSDSLRAVTADRDRWRDGRWRETHGALWPA